jgi:hypothetical protein
LRYLYYCSDQHSLTGSRVSRLLLPGHLGSFMVGMIASQSGFQDLYRIRTVPPGDFPADT